MKYTRRVETPAHINLKHAARQWLVELGCAASATEVRVPHSAQRADAAGYMDRAPREGGPAWLRQPTRASSPTTLIVECKQCRSDLLRDAEIKPELLRTRAALQRQLREVEQECVAQSEPALRCGAGYLFPELAPWDFESSTSACRKLLARSLRRVEEQIHAGTKFFMFARYHVATHLMIATLPGVVEASELPEAWGLMVWREELDGDEGSGGFDVVRPPPTLSPSVIATTRTLREIAAVLSRATQGTRGVRRLARETVPESEYNDALTTARVLR